MIRTTRIQALLDQYQGPHRFGYGNPSGQTISEAARAELLTPPARARIHAALTWIEANLEPAIRYQTRA